MNKPLLPRHERKRISWRETALALLALGCAAGWLNERIENRNSAEVKEFVDGLRQVRHNPDAIVEVVVLDKGGFPIACRMQRLGPPPAGTPADTPPPTESPSEPAAASAVDSKPDKETKAGEDSQPADDSQPAVGPETSAKPGAEGSAADVEKAAAPAKP